MESLRYRRWELAFDADATRSAYDALELGWPEFCGCIHCRNFARVRETVYPQEVRDLLTRLGARPDKETEVVPYQAVDGQTYFYSGRFLIVGRLAGGPDYWRTRREGGLENDPEGTEFLGDAFRVGFTRHVDRVPKPFRGQDLVQLEFGAKVAWVLPRKMPR